MVKVGGSYWLGMAATLSVSKLERVPHPASTSRITLVVPCIHHLHRPDAG